MAKVMLVEDDNNLREIYEARLAAEGYDIISAPDGEAALALAIKERPDLIISDIMMPKVSGFDMLDILRSTTETKNTKIIMMTALNQAEDKARAEKLGADMYLVKSQVTLEDVVRSAKSMLGEQTPLSIGGVPVEHPEQSTPAQPDMPSPNSSSLSGSVPAVPVVAAVPQATQQPAPPILPVAEPATDVPVAPPDTTPAPANSPAQTAPIQVSEAPAEPAPENQSAPATTTPEPTQTATAPTEAPSSEPAPPEPAPVTASQTAATSLEQEEAALQAHIEQFITDTPAEQTNQAVAPEPTTTAPSTPPAINLVPQPTPPTPSPAPAPPEQTQQAPLSQSSMAQPPSHMNGGGQEPQSAGRPEDRPAGEQVIVKSAPSNSGGADNGIDAAISGRKKVIQPISDMLNSGPDLDALLAKETPQSAAAMPNLNAVVTPEGSTLSSKTGSPTMYDVIAPNPSAVQPNPNDPPPAPPVA